MKTLDFRSIESSTAVSSRWSRRRGYRRESRTLYLLVGKRIFDLAFAILLLPVIGVLWVIVRTDGGPGFFGHRRVGKNGKPFRCWKIRSMCMDSEQRLKAHLAENPEWARDRKLTDDPRITRLGNILRKTSLDELPQIWNILKGDMSFVGPRPVMRDEMRRYGEFRTAYLTQKPGLTGLWQVSGRNDVTHDERVQMDVEYLNKASFPTDLKIIAKTASAVIGATGR